MDDVLSDRWTQLVEHPEYRRLATCTTRFQVVAVGRRGGKTEFLKRLFTKAASRNWAGVPGANYVIGAPTNPQTRKLYWDDLKAMAPKILVRSIRETDQYIEFKSGARLWISGMDVPNRIEGFPIDGLGLDEYADMKPDVWDAHLRPSLSTIGREGWAVFIGTPDGRNHFWEKYCVGLDPEEPEWESFTWHSALVIDPDELASAKRRMPPRLYRQEYEASFESWEGRVYEEFDRSVHAIHRLQIDLSRPLVFALDFNVKPGSAVVLQEQEGEIDGVLRQFTAVIGEVWIPDGSSTRFVCDKLVADYGPDGLDYRGDVFLYGDPSGGNRSTTSDTGGGDWEIVNQILGAVPTWNLIEGYAKDTKVKRSVNALNGRLRNTEGEVGLLVDSRCKAVIRDLDMVSWVDGAYFEINKKDLTCTHWSDALRYYCEIEHPIYEPAAPEVSRLRA